MSGEPDHAPAVTVAGSWLRLLKSGGVDYLFANAGTDFAPLIEAYASAVDRARTLPDPVTVPHENVAIHMAIGYWLVTRRMQAVMVHVSVGTANAVCGVLNAARAHVPVLFAAGRTPINEKDVFGARNLHIHWTQEMFDQASMVRESVKWEYELRSAEQLQTVVDRALSIAQAEPQGPVYLTLPREVIARPMDTALIGDRRPAVPTAPFPDPASITSLATMFRRARTPLIVTTGMGLDPRGPVALAEFASRHSVPVVQHVPRCVSLPSGHPMHAGYDPDPWLREADLVLVLDSTVPWIPDRTRIARGTKVVHVGADPLFQGLPVRGFECDLAITAMPAAALTALGAELGQAHGAAIEWQASRRERMHEWQQEQQRSRRSFLESVRHQKPIHPAWISHCLDQVRGEDSIVLREAPQLLMPFLNFTRPGQYFSIGAAGGLGWGLGAAAGVKLAAPDKLVIAVEGDGSYMFCEPVSAHYVALERDLPFLTVILDNQRWNEVRSATRHVYPQGRAVQAGAFEALTHFHPDLRLHKVVEAVGGHGERVTEPAALPDALAAAVRKVRDERRHVVLDIVCSG